MPFWAQKNKSMQILFTTLLASFLWYNIDAIARNGVPASLSDTYYDLPEDWRKPFWFAMFLFWGLSAMIIAGTGFMVGAGFGITLVGAAPLFKEKTVKPVHFFGAGFAAVMSVLHLIELRFFWLFAALLFVEGLLILFKPKNVVYWLEMGIFLTTFIALYFVL